MPPQVDTQTQDQDAGMVNLERGSEDEAIALFNQQAKSKATNEPEEPENELTDADPEEPEEGDPEDQGEPEDDLVEAQYEGKTYKVPPELQKALLRQADYSRKMNEVGAKEKDYAQRIDRAEKLYEGATKYAESLAKVQALDAQIEGFKDFDFEKLETEDPGRASVLAVKLLRLQQARDKAVADAQGVNAQIAKERAEAINAKRADMVKALEKNLPGWGDELGTKISKYAIESGFTVEDLQQLTDPRVVVALDKARKFDAIQNGKAASLEKAKAVPTQVLKPGAPRRVDKTTETMQQFQKSRSPDDAVAVLMARSAKRG